METRKKSFILVIASMLVLILALGIATEDSSAKASKYWIKINKKKNITTVYKRYGSKWKPIRAMICTTGKNNGTPSGTFYLGKKFRWVTMTSPTGSRSNEQYTCRIVGEYYLHSVWYYDYRFNHATQSTNSFNRLGKHGSQGCVRFSTMDAKWIYDNCAYGTKITVYSSKKDGPLGRPRKIYVSTKTRMNWDPTDPLRSNPIFKMHKPVFKFKKSKKVLYGKKYKLKSGVKVINPNANQIITYRLKVAKLTRNGKKISAKKFSTRKLGKYKITYYVRDPYMVQNGHRGSEKTFKFIVFDKVSFSAKDYTVNQNESNAVKGMSAKARSKNLTKSAKVTVIAPDNTKTIMSYANAVNFKFTQAGTYKVTYRVTNPYPKKAVTKTIKITVTSAEEVKPDEENNNGNGNEQDSEGKEEQPNPLPQNPSDVDKPKGSL